MNIYSPELVFINTPHRTEFIYKNMEFHPVVLSSIPESFKTGEFYKSLIENEGDATTATINLPVQYSTFELVDERPSIMALLHQLETVQYWCIEELPQYVFDTINRYRHNIETTEIFQFSYEYPLLTENTQFIDFLETYEYRDELRCMLGLDIHNTRHFITCARLGFISYFKYLYRTSKTKIEHTQMSKKQKIRNENKMLSILSRCQKVAAEYVQIEMLDYLFSIYIFNDNFPKLREYAAKHRDGKCLEYILAVEREYFPLRGQIKWTKYICRVAAESGNLACLKYAAVSGAKCSYDVACIAAKNGHYECYKYLCDTGRPLAMIHNHICNNACWVEAGKITRNETLHPFCKAKHNSINVAAANGKYDCLKYGIDAGCKPNDTTIVFAAKHNRIDCLMYLIDLAMTRWSYCPTSQPYPHYVISFLIIYHQFDIIKQLWDLYGYCPFDSSHPNLAASTGDWEMTFYIIDKMRVRKIEYINNLIRNACYSQNLACLQKIEDHGFPIEMDALYAAAETGNTEIFMYVAKKMESYLVDIANRTTNRIEADILYNDVLRKGNLEIVQYLYSFGYELHNTAAWVCIVNGDYVDCLDFILDRIIKRETNIYTIETNICITAAKNMRNQCVKLLHEKYRYSLKNTLYWAIINNNIELVEYVWIDDKQSLTRDIYHLTIRKKYNEIRQFIERNINVNLLY